MEESKYMKAFFKELEKTQSKISIDKIIKMVNIMFNAWKDNKTIFVIGNGGSASTATHFSCDIAKDTIVVNKRRFKTMSLVDNIPLVSSWTNDNGFETIFEEQLKPWLLP